MHVLINEGERERNKRERCKFVVMECRGNKESITYHLFSLEEKRERVLEKERELVFIEYRRGWKGLF
jgi:hypothetical protein